MKYAAGRAGFPVLLLLFFCITVSLFSQQEGDGDLPEAEGITVTATVETTQQMKVIDREEIESHHAPDLAELLRETLGLGTTRYGGYGNAADINIRGFDSERIAFLIDGVPVNSAMSGDFDIGKIGLNSVERIEVISGGSDTKYNVSGALGGVINIITVKKQEPGLRLGAAFSNVSALPGTYTGRDGEKGGPQWGDLLDTQNYNLSASYGARTFSVTGSAFANRAANHFLFRDYLGKTRRKESNEVWDAGTSLSSVKELPDYSRIIATGAVSYADKNIPPSGFTSLKGKQRDFSLRQNLMFDMPRAFRDDLAMEASLSYSWNNMDYLSAGNVSSIHNEHAVNAINRWAWYPLDALVLRLGADYRYALLDSTDSGFHHRHDGGASLTAEIWAGKKWLIIPSVKAVSDGRSIVPVPKLGLLWRATDSLSFRNNYFRGFKFPDFEDLFWNDGQNRGNADLRPEDGWGVDFGGAYRGNRLTVESTIFAQWTRDSIHWYNSTGTWRPENVGEAAFFGGDTRLGWEIPLLSGPFEKIAPSLTYSYLLSYLLSYGYTFSSGKRIPYMPLHTVDVSLKLSWKTGALSVSGRFEDWRFAETANLSLLKPIFLINATVNQRINKNLNVFCALRNILNTSYESFKDYPLPGLTCTIGMNLLTANGGRAL